METTTNTATNAAEARAKAEQSLLEIQPRRTDKQIWGIYIALCLISVVELYSASSHEITASNVFAPVLRHVMFLIGGLAIMLFLQKTHYSKFLKWSYLFAILSAVAMLYTLKYGDYINGARRSFSVGGFFAIQPAEMVKISAVLVIAGILSRSQMRKSADVTTRGLIQVTLCVLMASGLLFTQGLTNTLLLMAISLSMMLIGGVSWKKMGIVLGVFIILAGFGFGVKSVIEGFSNPEVTQVQKELVVPGTNITVGVDKVEDGKKNSIGRWSTWENRVARHFKSDKYNDPISDMNQQEQYSYIAQAHGGIFGVMPGNSRETARLPLAFSDYIYAIVIEEMGLLGGMFVLVMYLWLLARAGRIANRCQTAYPALLVIGMAVFIAFQAMAHMAIVTGVFPVSGQPLPLISKGGTSILITSMALGIMLSVSRFAARKGKKSEIRDELSALPDEVKAANPT